MVLPWAGPDEPLKLYLQRVRLNSGGYDSGGAYWGLGAPLYAYFDESGEFSHCIRASSRQKAKEAIRREFPEALFYR
jgi:hypothetical protein